MRERRKIVAISSTEGQEENERDVEIHVDKVAYVMDVIKAREFNGLSLSPQIVGP